MFNEKEIKWAVKKLYEMFDEDDRAEVEELMEMEIEDFFPDLAAALYSKLSTNHEYRMENNIGECMSYYGGELFGQLVEVITAARRQAYGGGVERRFRNCAELERFERRDEDGDPARREVVEDAQPPLLPFAGDARRIEKRQLA